MSNNKIILEGCIKIFKESNEIELNESETFEIFSLSQIHKDRNITFENIVSSIVDGGNDGGIDSVMIFIDEQFVESIDEIENFNFWHDKINTWLKEESAQASDLNWIDEEMLKELTMVAENLTESLSLHGRIDNAPIKLIHLWVDLIDR